MIRRKGISQTEYRNAEAFENIADEMTRASAHALFQVRRSLEYGLPWLTACLRFDA